MEQKPSSHQRLHQIVTCAIISKHNDPCQFAIVRRAFSRPYEAGTWSLVGGVGAFEDDPDPVKAVSLEVQADLGVPLLGADLVTTSYLPPQPDGQYDRGTIVLAYHGTVQAESVVANPLYVEEVKWVSIEELLQIHLAFNGNTVVQQFCLYSIKKGECVLSQLSAAIRVLLSQAADIAWPFLPERWQYLEGHSDIKDAEVLLRERNPDTDETQAVILQKALAHFKNANDAKRAMPIIFLLDRLHAREGRFTELLDNVRWLESRLVTLPPQLIIRKARWLADNGYPHVSELVLECLRKTPEELKRMYPNFKEHHLENVSAVCYQVFSRTLLAVGEWHLARVTAAGALKYFTGAYGDVKGQSACYWSIGDSFIQVALGDKSAARKAVAAYALATRLVGKEQFLRSNNLRRLGRALFHLARIDDSVTMDDAIQVISTALESCDLISSERSAEWHYECAQACFVLAQANAWLADEDAQAKCLNAAFDFINSAERRNPTITQSSVNCRRALRDYITTKALDISLDSYHCELPEIHQSAELDLVTMASVAESPVKSFGCDSDTLCPRQDISNEIERSTTQTSIVEAGAATTELLTQPEPATEILTQPNPTATGEATILLHTQPTPETETVTQPTPATEMATQPNPTEETTILLNAQQEPETEMLTQPKPEISILPELHLLSDPRAVDEGTAACEPVKETQPPEGGAPITGGGSTTYPADGHPTDAPLEGQLRSADPSIASQENVRVSFEHHFVQANWKFVLNHQEPSVQLALKHSYDFVKNEWATIATLVKIHPEIFNDKGRERNVYLAWELFQSNLAHMCVAKRYKHEACNQPANFQEYRQQLILQETAKHYANKFNHRMANKSVVFFLPSYIVELSGNMYYTMEPRIEEREWEKWNNNATYVKDSQPVPQAFSHFSFAASGRKLLVCDIQGWQNNLFTDPQVTTLVRGQNGRCDRGKEGLRDFFANHVCNDLCQQLGLPPAPQEIEYIFQRA